MDTKWSKTSTGKKASKKVGANFAETLVESCTRLLGEARSVHLCQERLAALSEALSHETGAHWLAAAPAALSERLAALSLPEAATWLTVFHTIGFCYWAEPRWHITYQGKVYDGSLALALRLFENDKQLSPSSLRSLSLTQFKAVLGGENELCLLSERFSLLKQMAALLEKGETLDRLLCVESALSKAEFIAGLPGFDDIFQWQNLCFPFLKRAQLLTADLHYLLKLKCTGQLSDTEKLTAFADYKLPQVLQASGAIVYSDELIEKIVSRYEFASGCLEELEIRAATIMAVEAIKANLKERKIQLSAAQIDNQLWLRSQNKSLKTTAQPYHRVMSIYY